MLKNKNNNIKKVIIRTITNNHEFNSHQMIQVLQHSYPKSPQIQNKIENSNIRAYKHPKIKKY